MTSFDEYRKKLNSKYGNSTKSSSTEDEKNVKNGNANTSPYIISKSSIAGTSFEAYRDQLNAKYRTDKIDARGVDKWFQDADIAMDSMDRYYQSNNGSYEEGFGGNEDVRIANLLNSSADVYHYLLNHKDEFENFDALDAMFSSYRTALRQYDMKNYYIKQHNLRQAGYKQTYQGKTYDEIQALLQDMEAGEEKDWLTAYSQSSEVMTPDVYQRLISEKQAEISALEEAIYVYRARDNYTDSAAQAQYENDMAALRQAEQELDKLQEGKWYADNSAKYGSIPQNADFAAQSQVAEDKPTLKFGIQLGNNFLGVGDQVYDYINDLDGTREKVEYLADGNASNAALHKYNFMTDTEVATYNYIYNTEGKKAANEYLEYLTYELNARQQQQLAANNAEFATEHPFWASAASVPNHLLSGVGLLDVAWQNAVKGIKEGVTGEYSKPINYNSDSMSPNTRSTTIRETVAQNIVDKTGTIQLDSEKLPILSSILNGKSFGDVYQLGMSMADSAVVALLSRWIGNFGTVLLGGAAGTQGMLEAVERGATDKQALSMGILNGVFEWLFEKIQLDNLLSMIKKGEAGSFIKSLLRQGMTEGFEEFGTSVANTVSDIVIMAEKSDWNTLVEQYMADNPNMSEAEASLQALRDTAVSIGWDFVGGVISGFGFGGAASAVQNVQQNAAASKTYGDSAGDLVGEALELNPDSRFANRMQGRLDDGKTLSGGQLNRLVQQNEKAITQQDVATIEQAAISRLQELGETGDVEAIAAAIAKQAAGKKLTRTEQQTIANSKYGTRLSNELNPENIQSGEYSSGWAQRLDTNRINAEAYSSLVEAAQMPQDGTEAEEGEDIAQRLNEAQRAETTQEQAPAETVRENRTVADRATTEEAVEDLADVDPDDLRVSDDGKTILQESGKEVEIQSIASVSNGELTLRLKDGSTVSDKQIAYGSEGEALLYEAVASLGADVEISNILVNNYLKNDGGVAAGDYALGMVEAFRYGTYNFPRSELDSNAFAAKLTDVQRNSAYMLGERFGGKQTGSDNAQARRARLAKKFTETTGDKKTPPTEGKVHFEGDRSSLTERQSASLTAMEKVAEALGVQIYVFESEVDQNGRRIGANGWYDPKDGSIHIDLHAGTSGEATMLFTLAHELTHFIKQWSPAKFKVLANFLMKQYGQKGVSVDALVRAQLDKAKQHGRTISYGTAYEEVIADSMETMLSDGKVLEKLAELKQIDKTLWEKIRDFISELAEKIREVYAGLSPDSMEGRYVAEMKDSIETIQNLFTEGLVEASENYQPSLTPGEEGAVVSENDGSGAYSTAEIAEEQVDQAARDLEAEIKYSIREDIVDVNGVEYERVVELDYKVFNRVRRSGKAYIDFIRNNLIKQKITVFNENGDSEVIEFAGEKERVKKDGSARDRAVIGELTQARNETKKLVIVNAVETAEISRLAGVSDEHSHQWLDENGWEERTSYVMTTDGVIYPVTLHIAKARDGRNILYDVNVKINEGVAAEKIATSPRAKKPTEQAFRTTKPSENKVPQQEHEVKKFSNRDIRYSERDVDSVSNRALLANALESTVKNDIERKRLEEYKGQIERINAEEQKLRSLNAQIRELSFAKGPRDTKAIRDLQIEAKQTANRINTYDRQLLRLEAFQPLQNVLEREKKTAYQKAEQKDKEALAAYREKATKTQQDIIKRNQEAKKRGIEGREKTAMRHKIRKTVRELNKVLNHGNKQRNVKEEMRGFASKALELADYLFTDHVSNDDLIRKGITVRMTPKEAALVKETEEILTKLYDQLDSLTDEEFTRLDKKRANNEAKLRDVLTAQRNERLNTPVYNLFNDLVTEYASFKDSNQASVKAAYNPDVERFLRSYIGDDSGETDSGRKTLLQNMRLADMTIDELWKLSNAYDMVLHSIRTANKLFVKGKTETLEQKVERIANDFSNRKIPDGKLKTVARNLSNKIGWNYEKLYYALERIGSETFTELVMNVADSENIVMRDVREAAAFRDEMVEKYGYNNWKVDKEIDKEFLDSTGKKFKLTLGQMMALYAYSRRDGAWDHIEYGGFVFGKSALTNPKPADAYKLSKDQCQAITDLLTQEQKSYAEDMQQFLSKTMGEKGNEVSMLLYGIKMFGEKNYFPIHIAGQFKAQAQEAQAKAAAGFSSMTNAGFTHAQKPNAKAPFVLEGFNEIWVDHVNEMSRYHGTVPALEDMRRVMNYSHYFEASSDSMSIKQMMENSFGKDAVEYFDNLYREANSGATVDKLQEGQRKWLSRFRKGSVAYSLSVLIQQPASIVRAYALIPKKYFRGIRGVGALPIGIAEAATSRWTTAYKKAYAEMLQYAPGVTMAKEIGGFDTASGSSIRSYLLDTNQSFGQKIKTDKHGKVIGLGKALLGKVNDNMIANLPNVADKIAWIEIWNAAKRETAAKHTDLATNSEEFMKIVGERFTEVIRATQVYDSVFAKSPMLKSKSLAVQYLVSFMNEPNTTANMIESGFRALMNGDKRKCAKMVTAAARSIVFTCVLKSLIYAMRDDDEDETYIEKYIGSLVNNLLNDLVIFNYIPVARDAWSLAQGYDVERPDMAVLSDAISSFTNVIKNMAKDTDDMTEEELVAWDKKVTEANWRLLESACAVVGIPLKNIRRDINAVLDHARIAYENAGGTTWMSLEDSVNQAIADVVPALAKPETKSKADKLYDAIVGGDAVYAERLRSGYATESSYNSTLRKALRDNDPRIREAAIAWNAGDLDEYMRIAREIIGEKHFTQDNVVMAIRSEASKLTPEESEPSASKAKGLFTADSFAAAIANGDASMANSVKEDIIRTDQMNGKTAEEAEKSFNSSARTDLKEMFMAGELTETKAIQALANYCGDTLEEADERVENWKFEDEHGFTYSSRADAYKSGEISAADLKTVLMETGGMTQEEASIQIEAYNWEMEMPGADGITVAVVRDYNEYCAAANVPKDAYLQIRSFANRTKNDVDENGKTINYSAVQKVMAQIIALNIPDYQKTAIAMSLWKESTVNKYKLW